MPPRRKAVPVKAGDAISVYWPDDDQWYDGTVQFFNADGTCQLLYADGEREPALDLAKEKYKPKAGKVLELIDRVRALDGDVPKQLKEIALVLRDMSDRLPSAGCCSSRKGWWCDWYSAMEAGVETGDVIALVQVTSSLGAQLMNNVTTPWWEAEDIAWRARLCSVTSCEGLVGSVEELRLKAVDWTKARKLFPNSSDSSGMRFVKTYWLDQGSASILLRIRMKTRRRITPVPAVAGVNKVSLHSTP